MSSGRWREIEELYHAVVEQEPSARATLLERADPELRREVESLLAQSGSLPEKPAYNDDPASGNTIPMLAPGQRLGPYRIDALLGAGGMGEVFRGVDTRLDRPVAVKTCREEFSDRFHREARAISALNHPHICTLYDVGPSYLVMELLEGETLADRIKRGKLSMDQTLRYGGEIASALAEAHAKGITHRDLKPGNIILTKSGAKVLDFGLAKSLRDETLTDTRLAVGTPAYMAPEQLEATGSDARTDIYALGLVLSEMATGRRPPHGQPAGLPEAPLFSHIVERCLAKDADERWQTASDVQKELEWVRKGGASTLPAQAPPPRWRFHLWGWVVAGLLLLGVLWLYFRGSPPDQATHAAIVLPGKSVRLHSFAISPDGRSLAIAAQIDGRRQIWLRALDAFQLQAMPTTEEAIYPFWSPDSRSIGFFAQGKLKTISLNGAPSQTLCDAPFGRGGSWNRDGVIVFSPSAGSPYKLQKVPATGGVPVDVSSQAGANKHPVFLPDGRHFLYLREPANVEQAGIFLASLDGGPERRILADVSGLAFARNTLLFIRDNTLMAQPLDPSNWTPQGATISVAAGVSKTNNVNYAPVTASETGLLLYQTGAELAASQFAWVDRNGKAMGTVGPPRLADSPALSADGNRLLFDRPSALSVDIWERDLDRGDERRLVASSGYVNGIPQWSPKGDRVVFQSDRNGTNNLYQRASSGGEEELLLENNFNKIPTQYSRDGRYVIYTQSDPKTKRDVWVLPMEDAKPGKPFVFVHSEFNEYQGQLSPDSHWLAYTSDESGRPEVYVRPFPAGQGQWTLSIAGGEQPRWRADGKELFFVAADGKMTAVAIKTALNASLVPGPPTPLFEANLVLPPNEPLFDYDVTPDGTRFLVTTTATGSGSTSVLNLITNWNPRLTK